MVIRKILWKRHVLDLDITIYIAMCEEMQKTGTFDFQIDEIALTYLIPG